MSEPFVSILMGSQSDLPTMEHAINALKELGIPHEVRILSAHRTPDLAAAYIKDAESRGSAVFIAAAGCAAHLAGAVAANTVRPVIGVPLDAGFMHGLDALLSTVQMPGGVPVATTAVGKSGAKNAAILAAQILALQNPSIKERLLDQRRAKREAIQKINADLASTAV